MGKGKKVNKVISLVDEQAAPTSPYPALPWYYSWEYTQQ